MRKTDLVVLHDNTRIKVKGEARTEVDENINGVRFGRKATILMQCTFFSRAVGEPVAKSFSFISLLSILLHW